MAVTFVNGLQTGTWAGLTGGWMFVVAVLPAVGVGLVMTGLLLVRSQPVGASGAVSPAASARN